MLARALMCLGLLAATASCGSKGLSASNYDRTCATVADCVPVYIGPVGCCGTPCPNTAVRASVVQKAVNDVEAARQCTGQPPCPLAQPCQGGRVLCNAGTCELESAADASTGLRQ